MVGEMNRQVFQPSNSKIGGLDAKWVILIAYFGATVLGLVPGVKYVSWLIPLIVFFVDRENDFIAFHAIQAFLLEIVAAVIYIILGIIVAASAIGAYSSAVLMSGAGVAAGVGAAIAFGAIVVLVSIAVLIFAILAAIKGYKYEIYEIPLVGKWAEKIVFKTSN